MGVPFDIKDAIARWKKRRKVLTSLILLMVIKDGNSEKAVGAFVKAHPDVHFTTKIGRKRNAVLSTRAF